MNSKDTFQVICGFLQPRELNSCRYLSKEHNKWCDQYITYLCNIRNIPFLEQICPKCSNWIDFRDITNLTHFITNFSQGPLQSIIEKKRIEKVKTFLGNDCERSFLFCEDCEYKDIYDIDHNLPYKGSRVYNTLRLRHFYDIEISPFQFEDNWFIIFHEKKWNEYSYQAIEYEEW
jgi:hypothetical protein